MQTPTQMPEMQTGYTSTEIQTTLSRRNIQMQPNVRPMSVNIPVKSTSRPTTRPKAGIYKIERSQEPEPRVIDNLRPACPWIPHNRDKMLRVVFQH